MAVTRMRRQDVHPGGDEFLASEGSEAAHVSVRGTCLVRRIDIEFVAEIRR